MNESIFHEYDIRGIYPQELSDHDAYIMGLSYGSYIQKNFQASACIVGQDNRKSSPILAQNLIRGLLETGIDVIFLGVCTTPMFSYATIKLDNAFGIMITASHNPKEYNGFKFTFDKLGFARGQMIRDFLQFTKKQEFLKGAGEKKEVNIFPYYKSFIKENINLGKKKIKVVVDPGNGTASLFAKDIMESFETLEVIMINDISDANFPNHHPDPNVAANLKQLQDKVKETKADIGIAYDGDADRLGVVDENGEIVSSEYIMVLAIREMMKLDGNKTFLYDVKCSKVIKDEILRLGGTPLEYKTGASYTRAKTNELSLLFGGEYSGHFFYNDKWLGFDCGIYNGLRVIEVLSNNDYPLSQHFTNLTKYVNTEEMKIKINPKNAKDVINSVKMEFMKLNYKLLDIDGIKAYYDEGWVLLRCSNTTPNLTIRMEADTKENLNKINNHFMQILYPYLSINK